MQAICPSVQVQVISPPKNTGRYGLTITGVRGLQGSKLCIQSLRVLPVLEEHVRIKRTSGSTARDLAQKEGNESSRESAHFVQVI